MTSTKLKALQPDSLFNVVHVNPQPNPQQTIWINAHQCVSDEPVADVVRRNAIPSETNAGKYVVKHLLEGNRGHYSPLESVSICLAISYFPHSVMQQVTRHRVAVSPLVQSFRFTGDEILNAYEKLIEIPENEWFGEKFEKILEKVVYLRPANQSYHDREAGNYFYSEKRRKENLEHAFSGLCHYAANRADGMPKEQARGLLPFDYRQHFCITYNARSIQHTLDLRWKRDAQWECQELCEQMFACFESWCPEIAAWYSKNRAKKARLSP